jgi:hypothetical protein
MNTPEPHSVEQVIKAAIEQHAAETIPEEATGGGLGICRNYIIIGEMDYRDTRGLRILTSKNVTPWLMDGMIDHAVSMIQEAREVEYDDEDEDDGSEGGLA